MPAPIPVLDTPRLQLRGHRPEDYPASSALWADTVVTRYVGGRPFTPEEVWARLLRYAGHWLWLGYGTWAVVEKASGDFVGEIGFADYRREIEPVLEVPEAGWVLIPRAHGKGYATEAILAALAWGDEHLPVKQTTCIIDPGNAASLRTGAKCGYRESHRAIYKGQSLVVMVR